MCRILYYLLIYLFIIFLFNKYHLLNLFRILFNLLIVLLLLIFSYNQKTFIYLYLSLITPFMLLIFFNDLDNYWIPDLSIIFIGVFNFLFIKISHIYLIKLNISGLFFALIISAIFTLYSLISKKAIIGFGDLKLYIVFSINLNILNFCYLLSASSILGIFFFIINYFNKNDKKEIPFAPAIIIAYTIIMVLTIL